MVKSDARKRSRTIPLLMRVLGHETRKSLLVHLAHGPADARTLSLELEVDDSVVRHQLSRLQRVGLVEARADDVNDVFRVTDLVAVVRRRECNALRVATSDGSSVELSPV